MESSESYSHTDTQHAGAICIIDGLWHVGKTTICHMLLRRLHKSVYIPEPNHLDAKDCIADIQLWYLEQWRQSADKAADYREAGNVVLMERSFLSTLAYMRVIGRPICTLLQHHVTYLYAMPVDLICVLDRDLSYVAQLSKSYVSKCALAGVPLSDEMFIGRYREELLTLIESAPVRHEVISVRSPLTQTCRVVLEAILEMKPRCRYQLMTNHENK
jgi:thymidylate kinase